ncbi:isochorismatase family protein [Gaopeijia maritima]|uniref:cysteine hydrolase family protein n=1 Tax=Gaopeijia maritima TaxID=3119007 RepID=UPI0032471F7A
MNRRGLVGWVVDVQNDFMRPDGRLYVRHLDDPEDPGAAVVAERIALAVRWLEGHADLVVFTGDWHALGDAEIEPESPNPALGTYPPHCMGRSEDRVEREGAALLPAVAPANPLVLDVGAGPREGVRTAREAIDSGRAVFIRKTRFDVFEGNAGTDAFVEAVAERLDDPEFVVLGVARDVCVTQAVDGLIDRGRTVTALRDATWGLGLESEGDTLARWRRGARVITLEDRVSEGRADR